MNKVNKAVDRLLSEDEQGVEPKDSINISFAELRKIRSYTRMTGHHGTCPAGKLGNKGYLACHSQCGYRRVINLLDEIEARELK